MRTDAQGAADEQDGDEPRADHLEFCEAEGISTTGLVDEIGATKTKRRNLPKGLQRKGWHVSMGFIQARHFSRDTCQVNG